MSNSSSSNSDGAYAHMQSRCRLIVILHGDNLLNTTGENFAEMVQAGDIACIIFSPHSNNAPLSEETFQKQITPLVPIAQNAGIAVIIDGYTRIAGRVGADGLQLGQDPQALKQAITDYTPKMMVGAANVKTRHNALAIGELQPDYLMFGKIGGDIQQAAHPKNLELATWWSQMVEIPCIVLGGNRLDSLIDAAKTGADFVALSDAIFIAQDGTKDQKNMAHSIKYANQLLEEHAPQFEME